MTAAAIEEKLRNRIDALAAALRLALPHLDTDRDLDDNSVFRDGAIELQQRRVALRLAQAILSLETP
jgi:hypothetical protein